MTRKRMIASFVMGVVGALVGTFLGQVGTAFPPDNYLCAAYMESLIIPVGSITGFLSCSFLSLAYLKFVENRSWKSQLVFGLLFGAFAGGIAGFITGLIRAFAESRYYPPPLVIEFLLFGGLFALFGIFAGVIAGFVIALLIGRFIMAKLT